MRMAKKVDPHKTEPPHTYECMECSYRTKADKRPGKCPECGGQMQNISISRET